MKKQLGFLDLLVILIVMAVVVMIALSVTLAIKDAAQWKKFAAEHDCKVVEKMAATTNTGLGYGMTTTGQIGYGMVTTITPAKTAYDCNDGVRYWR